MIKVKEASKVINLKVGRIYYYATAKEIKLNLVNGEYYLDDNDFNKLKDIVIFRFLGFSLDEFDSLYKDSNLKRYLVKKLNVLESNPSFNGIKKVLELLIENKVSLNDYDKDYYLNLILKEMRSGKKFYFPKEDMIYEDYKSQRFNKEYAFMLSFTSMFFVAVCFFSGGIDLLLSLFPYFFIGLVITFLGIFIPIKMKYHKLIKKKLNEVI